MEIKKKVTILDLAEATGISKSSISRYMRNESISEEKAVVIEGKIRELGYIRNNYAEILRTSKSNLIGIIVPDLANPFFANIIYEIEREADKLGYTIIIKSAYGDTKKEIETIRYLSGFLVDAVILCRSDLEYDDIEPYLNTIKFVSVDSKIDGIDCVLTDNERNGYELAKHLIDKSEGNVLFFSRDDEQGSVIDRRNGFIRAHKDIGKDYLTFEYSKNEGVNYNDLHSFITINNVKGILCRNDNEAVNLITKINMPMKFAGFDNIKLSELVTPKLTTVDQNIREISNIVFKIITGGSAETKSYTVDSRIICRESTIGTEN